MKTTYFLKAGNYIKIGQSDDPKQRAMQIATSCPYPVTLLKTTEAITEEEAKATASKLSKRVNGEWFEMNAELGFWIGSGKTREGFLNSQIKQSTSSVPARQSKTLVTFDLRDELTEEEIAKFEAAAAASGAESITEHFLNLTLRVHPHQAA